MYVDVIENNYSKEAHIQNFKPMFNELGRFMGIPREKNRYFLFCRLESTCRPIYRK